MSVCKYCGRQLTFTSEVNGTCYVCQTYGRPFSFTVDNKTVQTEEVLKVGDAFQAGQSTWIVTEVDIAMEGVTICNGNVALNICHTDKMIYTYDTKGKGLRYLLSFDELDMINLIRAKLSIMQTNELKK